MKNNVGAMNSTVINSGSYEIFNMPDYPDYPACDDIYNTYLERIEIDPQILSIRKSSRPLSKKHENIQKSHRIAMASTP
jgi:hypothetical protein